MGSGGSPVGLGSDVGGSIRMPAYFNGVFGHKCSSFLISNTGQFPDAKGEGAAFLSSGPLCRKARDLEPIVELLAEREMTPLEWDEKWESLRVWVPEKKSITWTSASVFRTVEETASAMAQKGATVERFSLPAFRKSVEIWSSMMHEGNIEKFGDLLLEGKGFELTRKFAAWSVGRGPHTFATLITLLGERIVPLVPWEDVGKNVSAGVALREELDAMLGNADILLFPSHAFRARKHNIPLFPPFQWGNTAIFNVLGLPVTQVPTGLDENGIPCGVQVVGGSGEDRLTMAVVQLEAMLGGWTPLLFWKTVSNKNKRC